MQLKKAKIIVIAICPLLISGSLFAQAKRTGTERGTGVTHQTKSHDRVTWNAPSGMDIWNSEMEEQLSFLNADFAENQAPQTNARQPQTQSELILSNMPKPDPALVPFLKHLRLTDEQVRFLLAQIETRSGIKGGIFPISAVQGKVGPATDSGEEAIISIAQRDAAGTFKTFLAYVGGQYKDYKYYPVVTFFDAAELPPLMHLRFGMSTPGTGDEKYSRILVSSVSEEGGIIRKRVSTIAIRNDHASIVDDLGIVSVDGCRVNPSGYRVVSSVKEQSRSDNQQVRHYYEHHIIGCKRRIGPKFDSSLDADTAYQWAVAGEKDILQ